MDLAEFWSRCEDHFRRRITEENETLVIGWEASNDDVWIFEGPLNSARAFKKLAMVAGRGLTGKLGQDAWKDWLDALRRNGYDSRTPQTNKTLISGQKRQVRGLLAAVGTRNAGSGLLKMAAERAKRSLEASAGAINTPFENSALLCLELALDASTKPDESDRGIDWDWASSLLDHSIKLGEPDSDDLEPEGEVNYGETPIRAKRGPQTDYKTASKVEEIVKRMAPDGNWRSNLDDLLVELDEGEIPTPRTWKSKHGYRNWCDASADVAGRGRHMAIEAIKHHLKNAKEKPTATIP